MYVFTTNTLTAFTCSGELNSSTQRLLVDWLEILDPEMISSNPTVEQSLLFGNLENKVNIVVKNSEFR